MTEAEIVFEPAGASTESLATLGEGHIAYVKQIRSEDVPGLFPQAPKIAPGLKLFALHAADGTPIMLTDSRGSGDRQRLEQRTAGRQRSLNAALAASAASRVLPADAT